MCPRAGSFTIIVGIRGWIAQIQPPVGEYIVSVHRYGKVNVFWCSWAASGHEGPIHLWDAFTGTLRCSYRGYNNVDELEAALSVTFSADGQNIFCGYKKNIKIFSTGRPGREYFEYPITHGASCLTASLAQPGVVAIGTTAILTSLFVSQRYFC